MSATLVAPRGPRFWIPLLVAASTVTFLVGVTVGNASLRATHASELAANGVAVTRGAASGARRESFVGVATNNMGDAAWQALYGPTAATWGFTGVVRNSMSDAAWQALYGPTAATWGFTGVVRNSMSDAAWRAFNEAATAWGIAHRPRKSAR